MPSITAVTLARDAEADIVACLESVAWADERLVVLDSRTTDRTQALALAIGARVVVSEFRGFASQHNVALAAATGDWVFSIDADERATPALADEIRRVVAQEQPVGWWVPRRNIIWGKEIRHGGWYPDYQLRLMRRERAQYDSTREVHEVVLLEGETGRLEQPLVHHNYRTIGQFLEKQRQYVALDARMRFAQGVRPKPWTYLAQPLREFARRYLALGGWRDGLHGLLLCGLVAWYYGLVVTVLVGRLRRAGDRPTAQPAAR